MRNTSGSGNILRLLFWESTIQCNLSCIHCRRMESNDTLPLDLSTPQAMRLIDQLVHVGRRQEFMPILVFSGGEPLCRPDLFELIESAAGKGLKYALATNGTLIDTTLAEKIKAVRVERVAVSLDGPTPLVHNALRQQEDSFEAAMNGIRCLRQNAVPFQINTTITRANAGHVDDMFRLAKTLGAAAIHLFMLVPVGCGQRIAKDDILTADEYERLLLHIAARESRRDIEIKVTCGPHYARVVRQQNPENRPMSKGCLAGSGVLFVSHSGQVFPCGYLPIHCGSVLEESLEEIWRHNKHLAAMRDAAQLKGKCGDCDYQAVCGGCRARAFAATGDYMEAEPMCAYRQTTENRDGHSPS